MREKQEQHAEIKGWILYRSIVDLKMILRYDKA